MADVAPAAAALDDPVIDRWRDRVLTAAAEHRALCLRGGGTKAFYGEVPSGEPFDLRDLRGISSYEPSELVVTVRGGTLLSELESTLAAKGQCLPFEPPRFAPGGTVGGMVAAGLSGPARAAVGNLRDYVLGATMLNGRGELLSFGGQVMKNVAGYDVSRLLAGSMGILGVLCEVSLKVLSRPAATMTLHFEMDEATALHQCNRWGSQPLPIHATAWWRGALVVRLAGARAAVEAAASALGGTLVEAAAATAFWRGLRDHTDEFFVAADAACRSGSALWRLSVPSTTPPLPLAGDQLIEWGGAQRWWIGADDADMVRSLVSAHGGHACRFRGPVPGGDATAAAFHPLPGAVLALHRRLKTAFDPAGVFNPGRLHPGL